MFLCFVLFQSFSLPYIFLLNDTKIYLPILLLLDILVSSFWLLILSCSGKHWFTFLWLYTQKECYHVMKLPCSVLRKRFCHFSEVVVPVCTCQLWFFSFFIKAQSGGYIVLLFFFFFFNGFTCSIWKLLAQGLNLPSLGVELELQLPPTPQPRQYQI